jgi:uncharacterized membrane protein
MKFASDFRASARKALSGKWWEAVAAGLLAALLGATGSSVPSFSFSVPTSTGGTGSPTIPEEELAIIMTIFGIAFGIVAVVGIALFILGSIVMPGYAKFNLDLIDGEKPRIGTLFNYFSKWKNALGANLLRTVYTFLWSLLFFIPGIIASYNYAMVPYIVAEDPYLSPREALAKSKEMMYGNRMRLFCLHFSFFGWMLLSVLSCGIGSFWLLPYQQAAIADFYREISGTRPTEISFDVVEDTSVTENTVETAETVEATAITVVEDAEVIVETEAEEIPTVDQAEESPTEANE